MTPEQRAAKIKRDYLLNDDDGVYSRLVADIARAIRLAENAAYERSARIVEHAHGGDTLGPWTRTVVDRIRAWIETMPRKKPSPAPSKRKAGGK